MYKEVKKMPKICVLIPCYNEEQTILSVIDDFRVELPDADIFVCDNNSNDKTYETAVSALSSEFVLREPRQGKGNAVRTMFQDVDADIYVLVDGDDTYPASQVHDLIKPVIENQADVVIGDRLSNLTYASENKRKFHNFGNALVKNTVNILFKSNLKDIMTGYRVFSRFFVKTFPLLSKGFEIETEMTIFALFYNYKVKQVPIIYRDRPEGSESKLNTFTDGFKVLKIIGSLFKDYRPLLFFGTASLLFLIMGILVGIPVIVEYVQHAYIYAIPSAILASSLFVMALLSFSCGLILDTTAKNQKRVHEQMVLLYKFLGRNN